MTSELRPWLLETIERELQDVVNLKQQEREEVKPEIRGEIESNEKLDAPKERIVNEDTHIRITLSNAKRRCPVQLIEVRVYLRLSGRFLTYSCDLEYADYP
jgi:hypothetical protein